ncbi:MAG: methylmalonyl Co-A mutase-associated GTPase MeaB [Bacteroidota bacterium]|nr:methylmalonyl Co-A mutase-associated GTPase MeaB [Bacteroidota bacterium]
MQKDKNKKSALNVQKGVEQPDSINKIAAERFKLKKRKERTVDKIVEELAGGNLSALSEGITLVESSLERHREKAEKIINRCMIQTGKALKIGLTGVPGVGKSSFIETLGMWLINKGKKVAVLAIDPSSERTGGSILGDKTRMEQLSISPNAFIRPSPSAGSLGGVARKTAESALLCESAGFDIIFIETVGVGQSETAVHSMTDFFLLLMLAGAGDELQGIKRGIMEMADALVINKADGDNVNKAKLAKREYENALHLFPPAESGAEPKVVTASANTGDGIEEVWSIIENYIQLTKKNGYFDTKRSRQAKFRMHETIQEKLLTNFYSDAELKEEIKAAEDKVISGEMSPYFAAKQLMILNAD